MGNFSLAFCVLRSWISVRVRPFSHSVLPGSRSNLWNFWAPLTLSRRRGIASRSGSLAHSSAPPPCHFWPKSGSGRGRPRAPSWRRLRFCRLRTGQCPAVTISCCRLSLGIVQPCASGCRLSRSCVSRIWISRTRAGPGQAAPPRGAAGAPPRPPCREGS